MKCPTPAYLSTPSCDRISKIRTNEKIFHIVYLSEHAAPRPRSWSLAQSGPQVCLQIQPRCHVLCQLNSCIGLYVIGSDLWQRKGIALHTQYNIFGLFDSHSRIPREFHEDPLSHILECFNINRHNTVTNLERFLAYSMSLESLVFRLSPFAFFFLDCILLPQTPLIVTHHSGALKI